MRARGTLPAVLALMLAAAACGDNQAATTTQATTTSTTQAATTSTAGTTTTTEAPQDPLDAFVGTPVGDPLLGTGYHQMRYADDTGIWVVSEDSLTGAGPGLDLLGLRLPDPMPATTGLDEEQRLVEAWLWGPSGEAPPNGIALYALGAGGWNPYVVVRGADILGYLETTTDYQAKQPAGPALVRTALAAFDWTGSAHFVADVAVFAYPSGEAPAYEGRIECTFTGTLECMTLSDDGVLRPGDQGEAVQTLQEDLAGLGYFAGSPDGDYGAATTEAVRLFQRDYRLSADGRAGPQTLGLLADVVLGTSGIVLASQEGIGEVVMGTPPEEALPALIGIFGAPASTTGWYEDACDGHWWYRAEWPFLTVIFTDRDGPRQFDGWYVKDLSLVPPWLYFAGGIAPAWRWSDFAALGALFDAGYGGFWSHHELGYGNGRFVDPPSDPPAAGARIRGFGTGTGGFVSC